MVDSFPTWPVFADDELGALKTCLEGSGGDHVGQFEADFAEFCGVSHALSTNSGSTALELALRGLGVQSGDEVIVPARGYFATAGAVLLCGGVPVFCDVDIHTHNIDVRLIPGLLTEKTRGIICVHLGGSPCDMARLTNISGSHDLFLIEDCAQAHGACFDNKAVGSFGDAGIFSFTGDKILSTQEGGMLVTHSKRLYEFAFSYRENGKRLTAKLRGAEYQYSRDHLGSNFRLSALQAALGRVQLPKLQTWLKRRRQNVDRLKQHLSPDTGLDFQHVLPKAQSSNYVCYLQTDSSQRATQVLERASLTGAPIHRGACPEIYREPVIMETGLGPKRRLSCAKALAQTTLAIQVHPFLQDSDIYRIIQLIKQA